MADAAIASAVESKRINDEPGGQAAPMDTGAFSLAMMLRFFKLPADPEQIRHEYSPTGSALSTMDLVRAARALGSIDIRGFLFAELCDSWNSRFVDLEGFHGGSLRAYG